MDGTHFGDLNHELDTSTLVLQPSLKTFETLKELDFVSHNQQAKFERKNRNWYYYYFNVLTHSWYAYEHFTNANITIQKPDAEEKFAGYLSKKSGAKRLDWKYNYSIDFYEPGTKSYDTWYVSAPSGLKVNVQSMYN